MSAVVTQAVELLPCPFCGEQPKSYWQGDSSECGDDGYWAIECCDIHAHRDGEAEAVTAWNQRHRSEAVEELVEVLGRLLSLVDRMDVASWLVTEHPAEWANAGDLVSDARTLISKHRGEQG